MRHIIFSVYDDAAAAYLPPFIFHTEGMAIRAVLDAITDKTHQFARHPHDYQLTQLGYFDDGDGKIVSEKKHVCSLGELAAQHAENVQASAQNYTLDIGGESHS